ncbi:MAG: Na+/H+ antiporter NhaC family protein [Acidobacteriota bacterium]
MSDYGWLSILPPLTAIVLALRTRQVYLSLFFGILLGTTLLVGWNPLAGAAGAIDQVVGVLNDHDSAEVLLFTLIVGALIALMRESGGVGGFATWMVQRGWVRGPRSAQLISIAIGTSIFIESNITCLVTGAVSRPLYDRVRLSRAKLAYVCDSTSAPICMLLPLNSWGALVLGLLAAQDVSNPLRTLIEAVPLNFYAIVALATVIMVAVSGRDIGAMRRAELAARHSRPAAAVPDSSPEAAAEGIPGPGSAAPSSSSQSAVPERAINLVLPVLVTVITMPIGLYITGAGDWQAGSGSTSVLWSVSAGVASAMVSYRLQGLFTLPRLAEMAIKGFQELVGVAAILALALALGNVCNDVGTGPWVARTVAPWIGPITVAPLIFVTGAIISFATGSSWGTFAILFPIAIPMSTAIGSSLALTTGAVMGGGIFGDHCSPISDTTVISSLSAGCDHIEHVLTQIPYALIGGAVATVLYALAGLAYA